MKQRSSDWLTHDSDQYYRLNLSDKENLAPDGGTEMMAILSIWALQQELCLIQGPMFGASKAFVKQFSLNLQADLAGKKIRVNNNNLVFAEGTEFSSVQFKGDEKRVEALYQRCPCHSAGRHCQHWLGWSNSPSMSMSIGLKSCRFPKPLALNLFIVIKEKQPLHKELVVLSFLWYNEGKVRRRRWQQR